MNEFTAGPWEFDYNNADDYSGGQWYEAGPAIVRFPYRCEESEKLEANANARLICAAPDLLEALILLDEAFCSDDYGTAEGRLAGRKALIAARAAIAKARGEA